MTFNTTTAKVKKIRDALTAIETDVPVYHYRKPTDAKLTRYIIWAEDSGNAFGANNRHEEHAISGTVDLYTQREYDALIDQIEAALNDTAHIAWSLNAVDYDDETNLIHYEWMFSVA